MTVLVAGSTGYLGRFAIQEFKRRGHWVRALARNPQRLAGPGPFMAPAVRDQIDDLFVGEVTDPETADCLYPLPWFARPESTPQIQLSMDDIPPLVCYAGPISGVHRSVPSGEHGPGKMRR